MHVHIQCISIGNHMYICDMSIESVIQRHCVLDDSPLYMYFLQSLTYAIDPSVEKDFLALALSCKSVICCRY